MYALDPAIALLEGTLNRYLRLDPDSPLRLAALHGRVIVVEIQDANRSLTFIPGPGHLQVLGQIEGEPDCRLRGTSLKLASLLRGRSGEQTLFAGAVTLEGDTETAQRFRSLWTDLDIDWEEQLSRLTGDPIAHQMGRLARGLDRWAQGASDTFAANLQEYLQEELRLLPTPLEVSDFACAVEELRDDVERLAARLIRLQRRLDEPQG